MPVPGTNVNVGKGLVSTWEFRRIVLIRMSHGGDFAESWSNGVGSKVRRQFPEVAGNATEEYATGAVNHCLPVGERIIGESDAG